MKKIIENIFKNNDNSGIEEEILPKNCSIDEAGDLVLEILAKHKNEDWIKSFQEAVGGDRKKVTQCHKIIEDILETNKISVEELSKTDTAKQIFTNKYGMGKLEKYWGDDEIDELRVDPGGKAFVTRRGRHEYTGITLKEEEVHSLIERLKPFDDVGATLDFSNPTLELVRKDGSRLTAIGPPVVRGIGFALRKHGNIEISKESFMKLQTMDEKVWKVLSLVARGRLNQLVCGDVNSGKTTLMKLLVGLLDPNLSIRVIELDNEFRVAELYPDREIWELEAHSEVAGDLIELFTTTLRLTPDIIIVPEFRGRGELNITLEACTRGHRGSLTGGHFDSLHTAEDIVRNIAILAMKEGLNLSLELAMIKVAQAFNVIIQTFSDSRTGVKKIVNITEIYVDKGEIKSNPLIAWEPKKEGDFTKGEWKILNCISSHGIKSMKTFGVLDAEIMEAFPDYVGEAN